MKNNEILFSANQITALSNKGDVLVSQFCFRGKINKASAFVFSSEKTKKKIIDLLNDRAIDYHGFFQYQDEIFISKKKKKKIATYPKLFQLMI